MVVKNYFCQYKPLNVYGKENAKVPILVLSLKVNGESTEQKQKSRQRKKKVKAILKEKAIVIDFKIK